MNLSSVTYTWNVRIGEASSGQAAGRVGPLSFQVIFILNKNNEKKSHKKENPSKPFCVLCSKSLFWFRALKPPCPNIWNTLGGYMVRPRKMGSSYRAGQMLLGSVLGLLSLGCTGSRPVSAGVWSSARCPSQRGSKGLTGEDLHS